jgi:ketosteroid isomerase-like protein
VSQKNLEIVRKLFEATSKRDASAVFALLAPEIEYDTTRVGVGNFTRAGVWHGYSGLRSMLEEWNEAWVGVEYELQELVDTGGPIVAMVVVHARGRRSGVQFDLPGSCLLTLENDKITRVVWFPTHAEGLEAAGLSE